MMPFRLMVIFSILGLTACSSNQEVETFKGTPGTAGMAYCVKTLWQADAFVNKVPDSQVRIIENRAGSGSFYIFDEKSNEMVAAKGTYGLGFGIEREDIDVTFYIPKDNVLTELGKRRLALSKKCAVIPTKERAKEFLPSVICTNMTSCSFRSDLYE